MIGLSEAVLLRHSVRQYTEEAIPETIAVQLQKAVDDCNREGNLHIQLVLDEPKAFSGFRAHYGNFRGVKNYFALIGKKGPDLDEKCGYYGEKLVLLAQQLGLNTCWVALTYRKVPDAYTVNAGEKLAIVISLGYGGTQGKAHRSKPLEAVCAKDTDAEWFDNGVKNALLAPTAINQQKFFFQKHGEKVKATAGKGPCAEIDLGIVKYHFEIGSGKDSSVWE